MWRRFDQKRLCKSLITLGVNVQIRALQKRLIFARCHCHTRLRGLCSDIWK